MTSEDGLMDLEELDAIAADLPYIKAWIKAIEAEILLALQNGAEMASVHLEDKIGNRSWKPGVDVLKLLSKFSRLDVVAPRVPLSPTQAEKTLGRMVYGDKLVEFVYRPLTGTKMVYSKGGHED